MIVLFSANSDGGILQFASTLLKTLYDIGVDVQCWVPSNSLITVSDVVKNKLVYYKKFKTTNPFDSRISELVSKITKLHPDFIWYLDSSILPLQISTKIQRIKQLLTLHDAGYFHPSHNSSLKQRLHDLYAQFLLKKSIKGVSDILVLSGESQVKYLATYQHLNGKVHLMNLGAHIPDIASKCPEELHSVNHSYYLFFGRIDKYKGLSIMCNAYSMFSDENKLPLVIAGKGYFSLEERHLIEQDQRIIVLNRYITDSEMIWLFQNARALVLPYIEATQSGIIPIAYRFGIPVITSNVPGLTQFVEDGKTGFICNSIRDYIDALKDINYGDTYDKLSINCKEYDKKFFSWNTNVRRLLESLDISI